MLHILSVSAPAVTVAMPATLPAGADVDGTLGTWLAHDVKPSKAQLQAASGRVIPDVLGSDLDVVFVGINPGLWSGATGYHFANPGNRFWKALHLSEFTDRQLAPSENTLLLESNLGVTNMVARTTARADELSDDELRSGARRLEERLARLRPRIVAILGIDAYRKGFGRPRALGRQQERLVGARLWVLPNPSGLNAHYQLDDLIERFRELRAALAD
jgi:double-stranded uracil-DNA glycosylase